MTTSKQGKGIFTISIDFELYWGVRDKLSLEEYKATLARVYEFIPAALDLFRKHEVHATWAAVGFLFCDTYEELVASLPERKPTYADPNLSPYPYISKMAGGEEYLSYHLAPSLIEKIAACPHQEVGTHTFSHYFCLEDGQTAEDFREDLQAAVGLAERKQHKLRSLVFPRNQHNADYLGICRELGITSYRGTETAWFYHSKRASEYFHPLRKIPRLFDIYFNVTGANSYALPQSAVLPVNLPGSRLLRGYSKRLSILEPLRLKRITSAMETAARKNEIFHLWFHPHELSGSIPENLAFLGKILDKFDSLQREYKMQSLTMSEITELVMTREKDR